MRNNIALYFWLFSAFPRVETILPCVPYTVGCYLRWCAPLSVLLKYCPLPIIPRYRPHIHQNTRHPREFPFGLCWKQVCFALLRAGADKNVLDRDDKTAQHLAESKKRDKIALLLGGWKPMGLTATQTQKIIESRGDGPQRYNRKK